MDGNEGNEWPWCAGFVTFVLKQACDAMHCEMPIQGSLDCLDLARQAEEKGKLVSGDELRSESWDALHFVHVVSFLYGVVLDTGSALDLHVVINVLKLSLR